MKNRSICIPLVMVGKSTPGHHNNDQKRTPSVLATAGADIVNGFKKSTRHGFTLLSIMAIGVTTLVLVRPEMASHLSNRLGAISPFSSGNETVALVSGESSTSVASPIAPITTAKVATTAPVQLRALRRTPIHAPIQASLHAPVLTQTALVTQAPNHPELATAHVVSTNVLGDLSSKTSVPAATRQQQALVTSWLAKKYRVAGDATDMLVSAAYTTARDIKLDPLLILSVMAIESGLNPFAESPVGAQGLMQVMSKIHHEKFRPLGGVKAALNPVANIRVGSSILKDYVTRGGSVEAGLKLYVGAAAFDSDFGYGSKVLAEYQRLKRVATGKSVPTTTIYVARAKPAAAVSSSISTAGNSATPAATTDASVAPPASVTPAPSATRPTATTPAIPTPPETPKPDSAVDESDTVATL